MTGGPRPRFWVVPMVALLLASACAAQDVVAAESWSDGERHGPWRVVFAGYGTVRGSDAQVVLEPAAAQSADTTHAGLVVTDQTHRTGTEFAVTVTTEAQLREGGAPNPWEVGWVLWHYQTNEHFYAVALKPNGWEVTKQDPTYPGNQRFLSSGTLPEFPIGHPYRVEVAESGGRTVIHVDGQLLTELVDTERPYTSGSIGLYSEDARVRFHDLAVRSAGDP